MPLVPDALKMSMVVQAVESYIWTAYSVPWPVPRASHARGPSVPSLDFSLPGAGCGLDWTCWVPGSLTRGLGLIGAIQTPLTPPPPHPSVSQRLLSYIATAGRMVPAAYMRAAATLYSTALHCTAQHCTALHSTALHCTAQHCTAPLLLLSVPLVGPGL